MKDHNSTSENRLDSSDIDALGHIIKVPLLKEDDEGHNNKIDVFNFEREGDRAQVYQMWAISQFAEHPIAMQALHRFNLAGHANGKENWTQLLEHIAGVTAIAVTLEKILENHGASSIDTTDLMDATLYDSLEKPYAIEAGRDGLATAALVHDVEKPAELAAGAGGLENSLDNPVLRDGALWRWLQASGVDESIIMAAQNTGRGDRLYSEYSDYPEEMVKKAVMQREALAELLHLKIDDIDTMTPAERRQASIHAKGRMAAIVGIADALAAQFKFQGMPESNIDAMSAHYLTYKKDPESVVFFGQDWPEYYKEVRRYLLSQVPEENRQALEDELDNLTHEDIFNQTVLPATLGDKNPYSKEKLRYPDAKFIATEVWTQAKAADPEKNEDQSYVGEGVLVLADGATDKTGIKYPSGKSGGRELAEIATQVASNSLKTGYELADQVTRAVREFYEANNPDALEDPSKRAATTLVTARIIGDNLIITQVGDTNVRITKTDGTTELLTNDKLIDTENAAKRSEYIKTQIEQLGYQPEGDELTEIIASGRAIIQDRLNTQYTLQNNPEDSRYGYGTIDGQLIPRHYTDGTPTNFVKVISYPTDGVASVELVSDGFYGEFPQAATAAAYRELYERVHSEDPHKYLAYLSTKPNDDATFVKADLA